jgi:hypothetical protein
VAAPHSKIEIQKSKTPSQIKLDGYPVPMQMKFHQVPMGAKFNFHGETFTKVALGMAEDEHRTGHIFRYEYEVESEAMDPDPNAGLPDYTHKSKIL